MKTLLIIILAITVVSCTKSIEKPECDAKCKAEIKAAINAKKIS